MNKFKKFMKIIKKRKYNEFPKLIYMGKKNKMACFQDLF